MILKISPDGSLSLADSDDFKTFKVVAAEASRQANDDVVMAGPLRVNNGYVLVQKALLLELANNATEEWAANLDRMIDKSRPMGWIDESGDIRAHIEWTWGYALQ